jgi:hypothetical protein
LLFFCAVLTEHARKAEGSTVARMLEKHVASGDFFTEFTAPARRPTCLPFPSITLWVSETELNTRTPSAPLPQFYNVRVLSIIPIVQPTRCTCYRKLFIPIKRSTCFERSFRPSSGTPKLRIQQRYMSNSCCYVQGSSSCLTYAVAAYAVSSS